jgi:protein-tyrosine phosphatase
MEKAKGKKIKMKRSLCCLLLAIMLLFGCKAPAAVEITLLSENEGGVMPIQDETVTTYLSLSFDDSLSFLKENSYQKTGIAHDSQNVILSWDGGEAPYTIAISEQPGLEGAEIWTSSRKNLQTGIFYPGKVYYWQVTDVNGNTSKIGSFTTDAGRRLITVRKTVKADGVQNVRDEGGFVTVDGKTVRYGMLYRGGLLEFQGSVYSHNVIDEYGLDALDRLGIRTELDLRNEKDCGGQTDSPLKECTYVRFPFTGYTSIYPSSVYTDSIFEDTQSMESFHEIFSLLSDPASYPVYFHCLIGQDRTGTLAYLILGLIGVDYEDIVRDYELTAFSKVGSMNRAASFNFSGETTVTQEQAFTALHEVMMNCYGTESGLLSDAVANYLMTECRITEEQISAIREILLEKE